MPTVEVNRIACRQTPHDHRNRRGPRPDKQMEMVGNECPGKTACGGLRQNSSKPFHKMIPVGIIKENLPPLNSTAYDVVQCTGCINASLSCHGKDRTTNEKRKKRIISWASLMLLMPRVVSRPVQAIVSALIVNGKVDIAFWQGYVFSVSKYTRRLHDRTA